MARHHLPARPGARGGRCDRRRGPGRPGALEAWPARRRRVARLALPLLRQLPPERLLRLPDRRAGDRHLVRRRLRRLPGHPRDGPRTSARAAARARRRAADVRRRDNIQRAAQQRCPAGRPRRGPRPGRARPPGRAVRGADGVPHRRDRPGEGQEPLARQLGARTLDSRPAGRPQSWRSWAAPRSSSPP